MGAVLRFDDPALLRVAWVADVLHNCGQVLASSAGTADTYRLSSQAECIQVFISHNWAFERKRKFLALAMHFNLDMAIRLATVALVLGSCLTYIVAKRTCGAVPIREVPAACTSTMLTFSIALLFGHEGPAILGFKGKSVFLDKACIHQTNPTLKNCGIISLGAFLYKSKAIVVCFTELYLQRLWTVYEFASFLLVHGEAPGLVHVMPAKLPVLVLASSLCTFCGIVAIHIAVVVGYYAAFMTLIGYIAAGGIFVGLARWWARQQLEARAIFKEFALANTSCSSESDRALVQGNIIALMRHVGRVDAHATEEEALLAFDEFVRSAGSRAFATSVGRLGVPYKQLLPILLVIFSNATQMWSASIGCAYPGHQDAPQILFMLTAHVATAFTVFPLAGALALHLAKCFPRLRGAAQVLYCGAVTLVLFAAVAVLAPTDGLLRPWLLDRALASERSCLGFVLYCAALFAMTAYVYRQPQRQVAAPAAWSESAGSRLPAVKLDMGTTVEATCEVGASPSSPGLLDVAEQGCCWEPEVAAANPDDCKVDLHGHTAEACSMPLTLGRVGNVIEASAMIVELRTA